MWLFTKHGYYAVVKDYKEDDVFWIRARIKEDLDNILAEIDLKNPSIQYKDYADYKYRLKVSKKEFTEIMLFFAEHLDYSNFKNMMDDNANQRHKIFAYYEVYNVLAEHFDK